MKRLRVLTISKPYVASAYRHKLSLLAARGDMDISLICPPAWGHQKFEDSVPAESLSPKIDVRILPILFNGKNHFHVYRGLQQTIHSLKPDIVNIEEEHYSAVTFQCVRAAIQCGARALFYTWQNIMKNYPPPFSWMERYVFTHAWAGVAGNPEAATILREKGFAGRLREIPQMGVDIDAFAPTSHSAGQRQAQKRKVGLDETAFWIGFAGRLVEEKGIHDLLRALYLVPEHLNVRVVIIGSGPQEEDLHRHIESLAIAEKIRFVPFVKSCDMPGWLQALDVLCLPSLTRSNWKEQFGRVLVEAMAAEAVVVGSSSGEIPRVIGDGGVVFPEGDHVQLGKIFTELASDPAQRESLQSKAAIRVRKNFSNAVLADRFADLFHEVAAASSRT